MRISSSAVSIFTETCCITSIVVCMPQKRQNLNLTTKVPPEAATALFLAADRAHMTPSMYLAQVITNIFAPDAPAEEATPESSSPTSQLSPGIQRALPPLRPPDPEFARWSVKDLTEGLFMAAVSGEIVSTPETEGMGMALRFRAATPAEQRNAIENQAEG